MAQSRPFDQAQDRPFDVAEATTADGTPSMADASDDFAEIARTVFEPFFAHREEKG